MKGIHLVRIALVLMLVGLATEVRANAIMFTDRFAWETTMTGLGYSITNIDFECATNSPSLDSVTAGEVVFTSPTVPLYSTHPDNDYGSGMALYPAFNQSFQVYLPGNVYAFGFDLGELATIPGSAPPTLNNVSFSTGDQFLGPVDGTHYPTFSFFGFLSDAPISSFSMHPHATVEPIIDNFVYAQAAPVPEPTTLVLFGAGLLGIAGQALRNRKR